jgi:uncharacterized protein (TIGR03067 family)
MRLHHFVIPAILLQLAAADNPKQAAVKDELDKFQGEWKLVSANINGTEKPAEKLNPTERSIFDGDQLIVKTEGQVRLRATWVIDPTAKPKTFERTVTDGDPAFGVVKGAKRHGIYELDGDTLREASVKDDKELPKDFEPGPGVQIFVSKRVKP